jgi:hypothetical protein
MTSLAADAGSVAPSSAITPLKAAAIARQPAAKEAINAKRMSFSLLFGFHHVPVSNFDNGQIDLFAPGNLAPAMIRLPA